MADVIRTIKYTDDGKPWLCILPKVNPEKYIPVFFSQDQAWLYSFDHNPDFDRFMWWACENICKQFNLGLVTAQKMGEIASVIEEGITELFAAKPMPRPVDLAVQQMTEEIFREAAKNAEVDGNRIKMTINVPVEAAQ